MGSARPRVVIVGAGFGGLSAARALAPAPVDVLLLDRTNYHLFQPLLYQVAVAALPPAEIAFPVRSILRRQTNLEFRVAEVVGFDLAGKKVVVEGGEEPYDLLIVASGAATTFFGMDDVAEHGFDLKGLPSALRLRNHVMRRFEEAVAANDPTLRSALLTIAVVGGGPTGVEVAGAVSELLRRVLARDYPRIPDAAIRVVLVESGPRVLPAMPEDLSAAALDSLERLGVTVRLGVAVAGYDGAVVRLADGGTIAARTLVWAAGVRATPLTGTLGVRLHRSGRIVVTPSLEIEGHPGVFAIGDAAYLETPEGVVPMLAPPAIQMGAAAAENVRRVLAGRPPLPFRYKDPGVMATIGRSAAVVAIGRVRLTGLVAWLFWLVVHLVQLVGFRSKLVVLVDWAWQYVFYRPASALITDESTLQHKELDKSVPRA
jgi:NADH dehydrogenase